MPYSFYLKSKDVKSVYPTAYRSPIFDQQADNTTEYNITNAVYRAGQRNYIISYDAQATGSAVALKVCIKGYIFEITKDALTEIIAEEQSHPADPDGSTVVLYVRTGTADSNFENTQLLEANGSALTVNCLDSNESSVSTSEFMGLGVRFVAGYTEDTNANSNDLVIGAIVSGTFTVDALSFTVIDTSKVKDSVSRAIAITYADLKTLRDTQKLIPGQYYRITDYACTTIQPNTYSAGHQFDIIVLALESNKLSEEAFAAHHDGDTYFANSNLSAWKLWYCLDNDYNRFEWADFAHGVGITDGGHVVFCRHPSLDGYVYNGVTYNYCWTSMYGGMAYFAQALEALEAYPASGSFEEGSERVDTIADTPNQVDSVPASQGGKGVIYRMIDEFGNDCPYDFKIQMHIHLLILKMM